VAVRSLFNAVAVAMVGCSSSDGAVTSDEPVDTSADTDPDSGDEDAAEQAMLLWQELVLRIPTDQRLDLVQLDIYDDDDPVAWVDGTGVGNQVGRYGFTVAFSADNFDRNPGGPCAPLSGHRGTFDWTLIHELHHIRGRVDGTVDAFTSQFPHVPGDGVGYPEDGTPVLDRDYVTSYAERSWGDEDAAESFTTYVMLTALPEPADALATAKVRWFDEQPDYAAWRSMIRITEGEGPGDSPSPAPRAVFPFEVDPPMWIYGTWQGTRSDGVAMEYRFAAGSIVAVEGDGAPIRYEALRDDGTLATVTEHTSQDGAYSYTALGGPVGGRVVHTRRGRRDDGVPRALRRSRGARAAPLWRVRRWARAARSRCRPPRCGPARRTSAVSGRSCDPRRCGRPARRRRRVCPPRRRPA